MKQRMYSLVLRQLTPIQKGIQTAHAVVDYARKVQNESVGVDVVVGYAQWADTDKTLIVLDAGTSQDLEEAIDFLKNNNIVQTVFREPDLYNMPTAVCFLADERVWDTETYPDYEHYIMDWQKRCDEMDIVRDKDGNDTGARYLVGHIKPGVGAWIADVFGGDVDPKPIINLREFIFSKRLSQ